MKKGNIVQYECTQNPELKKNHINILLEGIY